MGLFGKKKEKKKKSLVKRILKWTGITFLFLFILILILPYIFKDQIVQLIKDEANAGLNAKLDFGEVDLTLLSTFPNFTLELNDLKIEGVEEFEGVELANIKKTVVKLDLWSALFGDQYEIQSIALIEPNLHIKVLENGKANYDIAKTDSTATTEEVATDEPTSSFKLALEEYYIENGNIIYDDESYVTYIELEGMNHEGHAIIEDVTYTLSTNTDAKHVTFGYDGVDYLSQAMSDIKCDLEIFMPEEEMKFTFKENEASLNTMGLHFDGWLLMKDDFMDMDLAFGATKQTFSSLLSIVPGVYSPDFGDMKTDGNVKFEGKVFGKYSDESMPGFDMSLNVDNAWFQYPDLPGKVEKIAVDVNVNREAGGDLNNTKVDVNKFHMEFVGNEIDASMKLRNTMVDPFIDSKISTYMDLSKLKQVIPVSEGEEYSGIITSDVVLKGNVSALENEKYDEFEAKGELEVVGMDYKSPDLTYTTQIDSMKFQFAPDYLKLANFDAKIGESDLHADGNIDNYMEYFLKGELLKGTFNVNSTYFNLDELMYAPEGEGETAAEESPEPEVTETPVSDSAYGIIAIPQNVDFVMNSNIDQLMYDGLQIDNMKGEITMREGVAMLNNLSMNIFEGSVGMNGSYEAVNEEKAHVDFAFDIANLDIPKAALYFNTIEKLVPIAKYCKGTFSTDLTMVTDLDQNMEPVYESMTGSGRLKTGKVEVNNFPALNKLAETLKVDWLKSQKVDNLLLLYSFKDGRIWFDPYDLKLGKIESTVEGSTSFMQELDYTMDMMIPKGAVGEQASQYLTNALAGAGVDVNIGDKIPVKVKIGGTATNPVISTDLKDQGTDLVNDLVDQGKDKLYEEAQKILADAQARADQLVAEAKEKADQVRATAKQTADKIRAEGKSAGDKAKTEGKNAAEVVRKEGYAQAQKLIDEAKNPVAKIGAEKAAEKIRQETDAKADGMITAANDKGNQIENAAKEKAKKVEDEAEVKAKGMEDTAQNQADKIMEEAHAKADKIKE